MTVGPDAMDAPEAVDEQPPHSSDMDVDAIETSLGCVDQDLRYVLYLGKAG